MSAQRKSYIDAKAAAEACGAHILSLLETAVAGAGDASLAVSGGATPKLMFEYMARTRFDWSHVHIYWVDERCVPPASEDSNYRIVEESLIKAARIPQRNVHRIHGELQPPAAARRYQEELVESFRLDEGELPHFDVIHLGMGADAHIASLFPGDALIDDRDALTASVPAQKARQARVTLLPGVLLAAHNVALLVTGEDKGTALRNVFHGTYSPREYPAQIIAHDARHVAWFLDTAAASSLD